MSTTPDRPATDRRLRLGMMVSNVGLSDPEFLGRLCDGLETLGIDVLWLTDHIVRPDDYESRYPYHEGGKMRGDIVAEPLTTLAFAAARTTRLELGTSVLILPQRNPILAAKQAATLDALSGGRLRLGVGVGWLREEFELLGAEFAGRGRRTDDYLAVMQALWTEERPVLEAGGIRLDGSVGLYPRPARPDGIPVVVGGHSPAAVRRTARFGRGFYPMGADADRLVGLFDELRAALEGEGRSSDEVELIVPWLPVKGWMEQMAELGVQQIVMTTHPQWSVEEILERAEGFRDRAARV